MAGPFSRIAPLLVAALLLAAAAPPMPEESRAVLTALLAAEGAERGDHALCVAPALVRPAEFGLTGAAPRRIDYGWYVMPRPAQGVRRVDPSRAARLNQMLGAVRAAPLPGAGMEIDAGMMPAHFMLGPTGHCETLSLSAPAIVGDFAFVELSDHCGALCGAGDIVALQRRGGVWAPVAIAGIWVS